MTKWLFALLWLALLTAPWFGVALPPEKEGFRVLLLVIVWGFTTVIFKLDEMDGKS